MVQSVELLLDPATDAAVRDQWSALAEAGLPSQARHTGTSNRPHVTLAVATDVPEAAERALPAAATPLPVPVRLGGLVVFGGRDRRILSRLVVPSARLLELHSGVHEAVQECAGLVDLTRPGRWTPHVTLARALTDVELARALGALGRVRDLDGQGTAVRRWDGERRRQWRIAADERTG